MEKEALKILLVDDDENIRSMYSELFSVQGFSVLEANDGIEGLDIATREPNIDVIFTGIIMPRMDGFQLVQSLKEYSQTAQIPVVVNSHLGREEDRKKMLELGAKDFIVQGVISPNDVLKRVIQAVGKGEYVLGIDFSKYDGEKFAKDNELSPDAKCPKCASDLALKLKYDKDGSFSASVFCPQCKDKQSE